MTDAASGWQTAVIGGLVLLVVVLIAAIWSIRHHRSPSLWLDCDGTIDTLLPSLAGLSLGSVLPGNSVAILENGAFFDALLDEIRSATRSVHFEAFLWKDGELGRRLADALSERARAGVPVRVLLDAIGSCNVDDRSFEINDEITLGMLDPRTARVLEAIFEKYEPRCREFELERWSRRSPWHRLVDRLAYSINEVL